MVEKSLSVISSKFKNVEILEDVADGINGAGILVDDDAYDTGTFLDRDYDVRGLKAFMIKVHNIGASGLKYIVLSTTKNFNTLDTDLVDADFSETEVAEATVAAAAKGASYVENIVSPELTAVRLRVKRETTGVNTTARADIRGYLN